MNKIFKFFLVLGSIFILSVLLTPTVHQLLPMFKFEKIFNRLIMIFSIASAVLFIFVPNLKRGDPLFPQKTLSEYGFNFSVPWKKLFLVGFLLGAGTVLCMVLIEIVFTPTSFKSEYTFLKLFSWFTRGLISGVAVGIIEEFFFRGFVYRMLTKKMNVSVSIILASAFYSMVHFLDNGQVFIPEHPGFGDAIRLLLGYLEPFAHRPGDIIFQATGLFLFGIILNLAFVYTRSLFLSIGLHSGVVFLIKFQHFFAEGGLETYHPFFGSSPYYDGLFEWIFLILLGYIVWFLSRRLVK